MSAMSLRLPESLHRAAKELAQREGISVNQLVATALAEKLAALMTVEFLERAKRGNRKKFLAALARAPDVEPDAWDKLPAGMAPNQRLQPPKARHRPKTRRGKK
ncbi:MAG: toxin-antitoxin system HicB family antitoxin [Gemmatimonadetes bacterium]|nr:toxin-antitoxin system HicB family antitoxin [Gemmatimonadota bacterium]